MLTIAQHSPTGADSYSYKKQSAMKCSFVWFCCFVVPAQVRNDTSCSCISEVIE